MSKGLAIKIEILEAIEGLASKASKIRFATYQEASDIHLQLAKLREIALRINDIVGDE